MAAETGMAVDGHEKAWCVSKEKAEVRFNDCRLLAEEDAQRAGDGAELETRRRLHGIVTNVRSSCSFTTIRSHLPWRFVAVLERFV